MLDWGEDLNRAGPRSVSVFGVRGAFPTLDAPFREFGGNTSCMAMNCGEDLIVLDAGSGIVGLGAALAEQSRLPRIHILLSHLHLDHIQGMMGFSALHNPEAVIHIYGEGRPPAVLRECLDRVLGPPYWPIGLDDVASRPEVHEIRPEESFLIAEGITVRTLRGFHPNGSLLYRVEDEAASVVYALDCELTEDLFPRMAEFARSCSLLIWDANYTGPDLRPGWGHSTWKQGLDVARAAGAKQILMTHYDRNYTDAFLREQETLACEADENCLFAREGMVINL